MLTQKYDRIGIFKISFKCYFINFILYRCYKKRLDFIIRIFLYIYFALKECFRGVYLVQYVGLEWGIRKSGKKRGRFARRGIVGEMEDGEEGDAQRQSE